MYLWLFTMFSFRVFLFEIRNLAIMLETLQNTAKVYTFSTNVAELPSGFNRY